MSDETIIHCRVFNCPCTATRYDAAEDEMCRACSHDVYDHTGDSDVPFLAKLFVVGRHVRAAYCCACGERLPTGTGNEMEVEYSIVKPHFERKHPERAEQAQHQVWSQFREWPSVAFLSARR